MPIPLKPFTVKGFRGLKFERPAKGLKLFFPTYWEFPKDWETIEILSDSIAERVTDPIKNLSDYSNKWVNTRKYYLLDIQQKSFKYCSFDNLSS